MTFDAPQPLLYQLRKNLKHGILSPFLYFHFRNKKKNQQDSLLVYSFPLVYPILTPTLFCSGV